MYPQDDASQANDSPTVVPLVCPIAREAIVAERIAQIGDMIMAQHKEELEEAMAQVFGETARGGSINYLMFKSMVKHMMRSTVPEWYHVSIEHLGGSVYYLKSVLNRCGYTWTLNLFSLFTVFFISNER